MDTFNSAKTLACIALLTSVLTVSGCTTHSSTDQQEVVVMGIRASFATAEDNWRESPPSNRNDFETFKANPITLVSETPVSTFSADVDTASYSFVRRRLNAGYLPEKDAVRLEELVNYFDYAYPQPHSAEEPFKASVVVHNSPWAEGKNLIHIGVQGYSLEAEQTPDSNLVFLLDVSGSMNSPDKLPLVKQSFKLLLSQLKPTDTVAIVVYAGAAGTVLEPTAVKNKSQILAALNKLEAGGSTAGGQGIQLAYALAEQHFNNNAVNRIMLATDGDFNVGISDREQLKGFVERKREKGIYLSILGFGQGNYQDQLMQTLAQNGNGIAAYIDTLSEAQKVLVHQATSSLFPIATDLKLQVEFNPTAVKEYRLLGYETRQLEREDFKNDKVDAGDIGSGHSVTAIYEITLTNSPNTTIDELRYKQATKPNNHEKTSELAYLKMRYKLPGETESRLMEQAIVETKEVDPKLMQEVNFATAVAGFSQLLKGGKYVGDWGFDDALKLAKDNRREDAYGYRSEFVQLIRKAGVEESGDL
ncbi:YfbK domain-containing protein [Teredinibacter haidensis]|uniref:YfbK domain-containing protein n=1 Tax=Teredinibacter haidensis TaxID=2731755 RepID=UPI00163C838E